MDNDAANFFSDDAENDELPSTLCSFHGSDRKPYAHQYEVKEISGYYVGNNNEFWYLVDWMVCPKVRTWEQIENLQNCNEKLMIFFDGANAPEQNIMEIDREIENSLPNYEMFQLLVGTNFNRQYLDKFSKECLDLSPLFENKFIGLFVEEAERQFSFVVKALYGMAYNRDRNMFKRGQDYKILLKICSLRKEQLNQLEDVQRLINNIENCLVTVENTVDLERYPENVEYITQNRIGKGVELITDPLTGCSCQNACSISWSCCGDNMDSEFAYNAEGKLRLPQYSAISECNSKCSCNENCPNRVVQHGRKIKLGIFKTKTCGWGVKALQDIPRDVFVCEYIGEIIKDAEAVVRDEEYLKKGLSYLFDLDFREETEDYSLLHCIDATTCGNVARFINHSCDPNLWVFPVWIDCVDPNLHRLAIFSKRYIFENEEINFDYKFMDDGEYDSDEDEGSKIKCQCNSEQCRKWFLKKSF